MDEENKMTGAERPADAENAGRIPPAAAPVFSPADISYYEQAREEKKKKKRKKKIYLLASLLVVLCLFVSAVSGAVTSVFMYKLMPVLFPSGTTPPSSESTTREVVYVTEAPVIVTEPVTEAPTTEIPTTEMQTTPVPTTAEPSTMPPTTAAPPTTQPPVISKTKSQIYRDAVNSVVGIRAEYTETYRGLLGNVYSRDYVSTGSGFFVSNDGYLVTNYHVIVNGTDITVSTYDEETYSARVVGFDEDNDVAVLKIDAKTKGVRLGSSDDAQVGDDIMVIGNALTTLSYTFTDGLISFKNRRISTETNEKINMFQTNAAINSGNSGGPVYNMDGEVIGIASAKFASNEIEGLCFFIPIDDVADTIKEIIRGGS